MQAVILAAGAGSRLAEVTNGLPKCLVPIGERVLIEHHLEVLADAGIGQVLIVVGYKADEVRKVVGNRASYVENIRYVETNSLYSLWMARDWVNGPFVLMNCDLLFHPDILHRLLAKGGNALAYDSSSIAGLEQTKVAIRDGNVVDLGKDLPSEITRGESLGLLCFDTQGSKALFESANALINNGSEKSWVMEAVRSVCTKVEIHPVNIVGLPWAEIDFPYDLTKAQSEVWPAIQKSRWKNSLHWRKIKWIAIGFIALLLTGIGWFLNSKVGRQNVEWSYVNPEQGSEYTVTLATGNQKWWSASRHQPLFWMVQGPTRVRIDLRFLLSSQEQPPGRYVVEISLDGKPLAWEAFKATPDQDAVVSGEVVGDRDKIELDIKEGNHRLGVSLLAGNSDKLLVRVRLPEPATPEEDEEE